MQAAEWDRRTVAAGLDALSLMESAGRGTAVLVATRFAAGVRQGVLVACGPGNNGGDGWVVARALHAVGAPVWVVASAEPSSPLCRIEAALARQNGVREVAAEGPWPHVGLVVDALLGTGAAGPPRPPMAALLARLGDLPVPVVAVDGPTGLNLEDGVWHGGLAARLTVTFGGPRRGHLLARDEVGDLVVLDIGFVPPERAWPVLFTPDWAARLLPPLPARSHKGTRGRVAIVGGDAGMTGAARLAARAAFAAGAGLVHVLGPASSLSTIAGAEPDVQTAECPFEGAIPPRAAEVLQAADAIVVGPGLGRAPGRADLVRSVLAASRAPVVLDADALMVLAEQVPSLAKAPDDRTLVLTPHAGEFRALFPDRASRLAVDPWTEAEHAAARTGAVVLLKGVPTVIGAPARPPITVAAGNPGLATGGSGDTLSGVLATWLAQGVEPQQAAALAAQALGEAADLAARRVGPRALRPGDVTGALGEVWRSWALARDGPGRLLVPILYELPAPARG